MNLKTQSINSNIFSLMIVISFFSFGTFGFFNLFGLSIVMKIIPLVFSIFGLLYLINDLKLKTIKIELLLVVLFFSYYGLAKTLISSDVFNGIINAALMLLIALYIFNSSEKNILRIIKFLLYISTIFLFLGVIAFYAYNFIYDQLYNPAYTKFTSDTGNKTLNAKNWVEYFSFRSGDAFEFNRKLFERIKGFSNEPSCTWVHYLAPFAFAFFLEKKFLVVGLIGLLFSLICVGSVLGMFPIFLSIFTYLAMTLFSKRNFILIIIFGIFLSLYFLTNLANVVVSLSIVGEFVSDKTNTDFIKGSLGSASARLISYQNGLYELRSVPFGGSSLSPTTGLWMNFALVGGYFLLGLYIIFFLRFVIFAKTAFDNNNSFFKKFAFSFILSIFLTASILNSYGWDRIPGIILIFLYYKILIEEAYHPQKNNVKYKI